MDNQLHRTPHCVYSLNYHLVWIPRYGQSVLGGPVADRLKILLGEVAAHYEFEILAVEVTPALACGASVPDHTGPSAGAGGQCRCVHLFVSARPKFSPAQVVPYFKGIPSRRLKQEFAYLRRQ